MKRRKLACTHGHSECALSAQHPSFQHTSRQIQDSSVQQCQGLWMQQVSEGKCWQMYDKSNCQLCMLHCIRFGDHVQTCTTVLLRSVRSSYNMQPATRGASCCNLCGCAVAEHCLVSRCGSWVPGGGLEAMHCRLINSESSGIGWSL